ncbi:MAG TPA: gamma-glutamyltransferase family protein [Thermoleophilaceae bacterium]|nr:gamma-glutamyltransferase family protein [Thermoleophilaceae bacterium]
MRDFQLPGRSPAVASGGMAATSHPLATLAAVDVLRRGGNAADAAIAAVAVLCVVEPQSTGIGGDCFWMYAPPGAVRPFAYNGAGRAPAAIPALEEIGTGSPHSVTVPGAVDAWARLAADHGTMELGALLADAIRHADEGFAVQAAVAADWALASSTLAADPDAAAAYLDSGGGAPAAGDVVRFPRLAATLRAIAAGGRDVFYQGEVAADIAAKLQALGGAMTQDDLAAHRGEPVEPISIEYRGATVFECPPPGQGVIALELLAVLAGFDLAGIEPDSAIRLHLECEAGRLCFADRDAVLCDGDVPVDVLLSDTHASALRARIDLNAAMAEALPVIAGGHRDTVYLATADAGGGTCSLINSLFHPFGSGILAPGSGVLLQNRGSGFATAEGHPNRVAPGKRPLHTIIPGMALEPEGSMLAFGVMGGDYQPFGHAHFLGNLRDHGLDLQQALDLPRVFHTHGVLLAETSLPEDTIRGLEARGHQVLPAGGGLGGGQAVRVDRGSGVLTGASDHRKDGFAAGP